MIEQYIRDRLQEACRENRIAIKALYECVGKESSL